MSIRTRIIDRLASPELLPAREKARAARRLALGTAARLRRTLTRGRVPGLLSIVVPMYGVERYIGECLESLQRQNYDNVQIVVVDDGSPDGSYEVARRYAKRDPRIEIVRQQNGGLSAARNTGVRHARGEFLAFLDSDDFVDRHAYQEALDSLRSTGSDFAVLPYRRERNGGFPPAGEWVRAAHEVHREATNIHEFPDIMVNAVAWSKVYRREFWDRHGFEFPVGLLYEDQAVSMAAYAAADSFDVLSHISLNWRIRSDQTSITQQLSNPKNISDHFIAVRDSLAQLERFDAHDAVEIRVLQNLNNNLGEFLPNIGQMGEEAWAAFREFLSFLSDHATPEMWREVEARKKVLIGLCVADERDLAERFLREHGWYRDQFGGELRGDTLVAQLPLASELAAVLPESAFEYSEAETQLIAVFRRARVRAEAVRIDVFAYVNHLRMDVEDIDLRVWLVQPDGSELELSAVRGQSHKDSLGHTRAYADMSVGALSVEVPVAALQPAGDRQLRMELSAGVFNRAAAVALDEWSEFTLVSELGDPSLFFAVEGEPEAPALLRTSAPGVRVVRATLDGNTVMLELESTHRLSTVGLVRVDDRLDLRREATPVEAIEAGLYRALLQIPDLPRNERGPVEYLLIASDASGVEWHPSANGAEIEDRGSHALLTEQLHTSPAEFLEQRRITAERPGALNLVRPHAGRALVVDYRDAVIVTGVSLVDANGAAVPGTDVSETDAVALRLELQEPTGRASLERVRARAGSAHMDVAVERSGNRVSAVLPLRHDRWGLGETALKRGLYRLRGTSESGTRIRFYAPGELLARHHTDLLSSAGRISVARSPRDLLRLEVAPPLRDEERGEGNRLRMRDAAEATSHSLARTVLFRNRYGEDANDSALAVYRELQRRGNDLELIWAVRDASIHVPEGAKTVLEESRDYYEAFARSKYLMVNVHQPDWHHKPEGQILIQTHHGYPFKLQGRRWWAQLGDTAERMESLFTRADEWDYLVSPAAYATAPLKEFYRSSDSVPSEILEIGYPRNDALIDEDAAALRDDTRARLGIAPEQRVVLYAPTYRDYLSADQMSADVVPELVDFPKLSADLGENYVILMRGHPFNAGADIGATGAFINVTDYPDINHLILASDLAILDYSSLRFDYALTGKPSLFFVPDKARYFAGRESFVPYAETSPGPHLHTQEELLAAIRDADDVAKRYEGAREQFVADFMEEEDGHAAARLVDIVFASRGDAMGPGGVTP